MSLDEKALKARDAALSGALQQIERQFGKGSVMRMGDPGAQDGALPNSRLAVQDRQPRRHQVRGDHLALAFAPEKEERVEIGVLERSKPFVRRGRSSDEHAHATASAVVMPA